MIDVHIQLNTLRRKCERLELALRAARSAADVERRAAAAARESAARAWAIGFGPMRVRANREEGR